MFDDKILEAVNKFKEFKDTVHIVSHHDADGLSSAAIIIKACLRAGKKFTFSSVPHLDEHTIDKYRSESYSNYMFLDLGSSAMRLLKKLGKNIIVLDHHISSEEPTENILEVNPWKFSIDGSVDISASGIAYLFAEKLDKRNTDLAYLAVIGAVGDVQDNLSSYNSKILEIAISNRQIEKKKDILFYGAYSKPLYKVLQYTTKPHIPGVSGSEIGSIKFLKGCGIPIKKGDVYTKLSHLTEQQKTILINGILERNSHLTMEDIVGDVFLIRHYKRDSPLKDTREFATLLNGCGRLNKPSYAIGACLRDKKITQKALEEVGEYKRQLVDSFAWFESQRNSEDVLIEDNYIIFNAGNNIPPSLLSVVTTIISYSSFVNPNTLILGMARDNEVTKVSFRLSGNSTENYNLIDILSDSKYFVQLGGHKRSAGGIISSSDEKKFIASMQKKFSDILMEEKIN